MSHSSDRFREAYERILLEIDALPDTQLAVVSVDISEAVSNVLAASPRFAEVVELQELESYALALGHAQALYEATSYRGQSPAARVLATSRRLRAFSLFARAYEQARRIHDDDGVIVPALYGGRCRRSRKLAA